MPRGFFEQLGISEPNMNSGAASARRPSRPRTIMVRYMKRLVSVAGAGSDSDAGVAAFERLLSMI
jgi:hypothetical protein